MARARGRGRGRGRVGHGGGGGVKQFLALHTGRQANRIASAEAGAQYNPEIRSLRGQAAGSRKRQADLGSWYAQLASDYQGAQDAGAAALQSIENTTSQQLSEAAGRSSSDQQRLASEDESFAKLVGGPKDTTGLSKIAQAGAAAERARVALNLPVAQEQANFVGRLGGEKTAARMSGIEKRQEEARRRDKLIADLNSVRKERGAAKIAGVEKIRESDRGYQQELAKLQLARREARSAEQAAAASAALAQLKAAHEARQDAIGNRQNQEKINIDRRRAKAYERKAKSGGGISATAKLGRREHAGDAMAAAKSLLGVKVPKNGKQWAQFQEALIEKLGSSYSAEAARAVAKLRQMQAAKSRGGYERRIRRGEVAGPLRPRR